MPDGPHRLRATFRLAANGEPLRTRLLSTLLCLTMVASIPGASADFTDSNYHQYLLYNMDQTEVDVLIMPSASPYTLRDNALVMDSIQAWDAGINHKGPTWLANGLNIHAYRLGVDTNIPPEALWDPEIVVVPAEFNPVLLAGVGLEAWQQLFTSSPCHGIGSPLAASANGPTAQDLTRLPGFHTHPGSSWGMVRTNSGTRGCASGGTTCFVVATNFLTDPFGILWTNKDNSNDMYDLISHEFGHCLGIGHVGDALDFTASTYPRDDIMSYENDGWDPSYVLCVSSLDILGLEQEYGWLLGQTGYTSTPAGGFVSQAPSAWSTDSCTTPNVGILGSMAGAEKPARCPAGLGPIC